mmetsp:Transcript_4951/g.31732  ORF Transcript_4951/g.31732 Transcript_4951/m.31732 type:complete len:295 (+) Transcript_4951:1286-2170(+)
MSAASAASSHIPLSINCSTTGDCTCFFFGFGCTLGLICVSLIRPSCGIPGPWWHTVRTLVRLAIVHRIVRHVNVVSVSTRAPTPATETPWSWWTKPVLTWQGPTTEPQARMEARGCCDAAAHARTNVPKRLESMGEGTQLEDAVVEGAGACQGKNVRRPRAAPDAHVSPVPIDTVAQGSRPLVLKREATSRVLDDGESTVHGRRKEQGWIRWMPFDPPHASANTNVPGKHRKAEVAHVPHSNLLVVAASGKDVLFVRTALHATNAHGVCPSIHRTRNIRTCSLVPDLQHAIVCP